jgi:DNA invertase Pin-like site-specific DNA recombinase
MANTSPSKKVQVLQPVLKQVLEGDGNKPSKKRVCAYCRVSTDSEEQMESFDAQVSEYTKKITDNPDWNLVDIYADAGFSGTNVKHRLAFNRMIRDCESGKIDLVITKSISRFARNTVHCLQHVRDLKNIGVEVFFEKENIYSFDSKMELVLTMLSSIAQEESRNISENTKWGLKKRFRDGVAICNTDRLLGYDKDEKGNLIINEEQAKLVRRIFREYLDGKGYESIAQGIQADGIKTVVGKTTWWDSTIRGILENEKYYGELLLQKTVTLDYLTKKRVDNKNLEPMYRIEDNHEAIVSKEMFGLVQLERQRRFEITRGKNTDRRKYANKYGFSGKLYCEKCGKTLKRRHWNSGLKSEKIVWQCNSYIKGVENCPTKAVNDTDLKEAFIRLYNDMVKDKGFFFKMFLENINKVMTKESKIADIKKLTETIGLLEQDLSELVQLRLRKQIDDKFYNKEYAKITEELESVSQQKNTIEMEHLDDVKYRDKLDAIGKIINNGDEPLAEFDDDLFVALIDKVIIKSPTHFLFILESGQEYEVDYSSQQQSTHVETVCCLQIKHS